MRLLAYGGNAFVERHRIGHWPTIATGVLGDFYGVEGGVTAFGCAGAQDSTFLIWRTLRGRENRGGYPYTLLIDPGSDAWASFAYNAAALLQAIVADGALSSALLDDAERLTHARLEEHVARLRPQPQKAVVSKASALWALSAASTSSLVFGGTLPSVDECAAFLQGVPACFRLAGGWIVSGCLPHAEAFGARLVFDARFGGPPHANQVHVGESTLRLMQQGCADAELRGDVQFLSTVPADWWGVPVTTVTSSIEQRRARALAEIAESVRRSLGPRAAEAARSIQPTKAIIAR